MENNEIKDFEEITSQDGIFSQEILTNIREHKMSPRPRWQFLFKNIVLWVIGFLALFFGAISISLIIFMLRYNEWAFYSRMGAGPTEFLLLVVPIFWILCLLIFVVLVYFNFKKTKHGYRYRPLLIISGAVGISIILGFGFNALGMGQRIDAILGRRAPLYDSVINPRLRFWSNPESGRLSGLIVSQESEGNYIVVDNNNVEWSVVYVEEEDEKLNEAKKQGNIDEEIYTVAVGRPARFVGEKTAEKEFKAKELVPFHPGREFFQRFEKGHGSQINKKNPDKKGAMLSNVPKPDLAQPEFDPSGMMPPALLKDDRGPKSEEKKAEFANLLEKYPDFKEAFSKNLLVHKEMIQSIIKKDPEFIKNLENLKIDPKVLQDLNK